MPRFFVSSECVASDTVYIKGDDARHIALSLRMAAGEKVTVCGDGGAVYICRLVKIHPDIVEAAILSKHESDAEAPCRICLYVAVPKGDKLELIVQKAVELGAFSVTPFISERCVARPEGASADKKLVRLRRIAAEAAKQCGRGAVPEVLPVTDFDGAVIAAARAELPILCYEGEGTTPLGDVMRGALKRGTTVSVMTGSEGGFSVREVDFARSHGMKPCGLGKRILRCETAPIFMLSAIAYESELNLNF